jgi:lipoyl-dependent peroxiredoxin
MPVDVKYTAKATATGGRDGQAKTEDGAFSVKLGVPKEMGGNGQGNNPEQLFAAGYSACFLGAMKAVASHGGTAKVPNDATVTATVGIGPRSEGGFGLDVSLDVSLPGVPHEEAEALVQKAHQVCPYSNATRNGLDVRLRVV